MIMIDRVYDTIIKSTGRSLLLLLLVFAYTYLQAMASSPIPSLSPLPSSLLRHNRLRAGQLSPVLESLTPAFRLTPTTHSVMPLARRPQRHITSHYSGRSNVWVNCTVRIPSSIIIIPPGHRLYPFPFTLSLLLPFLVPLHRKLRHSHTPRSARGTNTGRAISYSALPFYIIYIRSPTAILHLTF